MIDVAVQNAWTLHKKSAGKLIHRAFKVEIAQAYLARYGVPPKRTMSLSLSHSGGRKRVADELQYNGVDHYLIGHPQNFAEDVLVLIARNVFQASAVNAMLVCA